MGASCTTRVLTFFSKTLLLLVVLCTGLKHLSHQSFVLTQGQVSQLAGKLIPNVVELLRLALSQLRHVLQGDLQSGLTGDLSGVDGVDALADRPAGLVHRVVGRVEPIAEGLGIVMRQELLLVVFISARSELRSIRSDYSFRFLRFC